ncbi:MAG: hypothetical protein JO027_22215 [Solirubrobacterales bacterium]|nr:hypothetical protein [Solirubrobacterales bacterium]
MRVRPWIVVPLALLASCGSSAAKSSTGATSTAGTPPVPGFKPIAGCGPAHATTLAGDVRVRVYTSGQAVYGCSAARGRSFRLGHVSRSISEARVGPVAVAGNLAAYGLTSFGIDTVRAVVVVRRLTDGSQLNQLSATRAVGAESFQSIGSIVAIADGAVAWIASETSIVGHRRAIEVHAAGAGGDRILDSGPSIDPASLRLHGSALSWVDGRVTHRATLR